MIFDSVTGLIRIGLITVLAYAAIILVLRVSGKRTLSKLSAFDFIVTIALGSVLATVILSADVVLLEGILAFSLLALLQGCVARLSVVSRFIRAATRSQPTLLVRDGVCLQSAMSDERITADDIATAVRQSGIGRLEEVGAVVLETDGSLSVLKGTSAEMDLLRGVRDGALGTLPVPRPARRRPGHSSP